MGTILNMADWSKILESASSSFNNFLIKPSMIKDETVSPGCIRQDIRKTFFDASGTYLSVIVSKGMANPVKL